MTENMHNIETNARETERVSSEIDRAKREGNVAEEERLKVQLTRLMDERAKYDSVRREMEGSSDYVPTSPVYTSSTPTSEEDAADRVRGAVASFNAKMLDKYGDNDKEIPESDVYSPRTPSSPAYTSLFDDDQRGGRVRPHLTSTHTGKYIPQIPTGVLENYLTTKYGKTVGGAHGSAVMTGGNALGANGAITGLPTMNIPVVATMPMAGMMPIQQGGVGSTIMQQSQGQGQQPSQQQQQNQPLQTGGGGTTPTPNEQGVKTFSIKL
jgi:hypothetical protein